MIVQATVRAGRAVPPVLDVRNRCLFLRRRLLSTGLHSLLRLIGQVGSLANWMCTKVPTSGIRGQHAGRVQAGLLT